MKKRNKQGKKNQQLRMKGRREGMTEENRGRPMERYSK
jgi:hypothetical protein